MLTANASMFLELVVSQKGIFQESNNNFNRCSGVHLDSRPFSNPNHVVLNLSFPLEVFNCERLKVNSEYS